MGFHFFSSTSYFFFGVLRMSAVWAARYVIDASIFVVYNYTSKRDECFIPILFFKRFFCFFTRTRLYLYVLSAHPQATACFLLYSFAHIPRIREGESGNVKFYIEPFCEKTVSVKDMFL